MKHGATCGLRRSGEDPHKLGSQDDEYFGHSMRSLLKASFFVRYFGCFRKVTLLPESDLIRVRSIHLPTYAASRVQRHAQGKSG